MAIGFKQAIFSCCFVNTIVFSAKGCLIPYLTLVFQYFGFSAFQVGMVFSAKAAITFCFIPLWLSLGIKGYCKHFILTMLLGSLLGNVALSVLPRFLWQSSFPKCKTSVQHNASQMEGNAERPLQGVTAVYKKNKTARAVTHPARHDHHFSASHTSHPMYSLDYLAHSVKNVNVKEHGRVSTNLIPDNQPVPSRLSRAKKLSWDERHQSKGALSTAARLLYDFTRFPKSKPALGRLGDAFGNMSPVPYSVPRIILIPHSLTRSVNHIKQATGLQPKYSSKSSLKSAVSVAETHQYKTPHQSVEAKPTPNFGGHGKDLFGQERHAAMPGKVQRSKRKASVGCDRYPNGHNKNTTIPASSVRETIVEDSQSLFSACLQIFMALFVLVLIIETSMSSIEVILDDAWYRFLDDTDEIELYGKEIPCRIIPYCIAPFILSWVIEYTGCINVLTQSLDSFYLHIFANFVLMVIASCALKFFPQYPDVFSKKSSLRFRSIPIIFYDSRVGLHALTAILLGGAISVKTNFLFWLIKAQGGNEIIMAGTLVAGGVSEAFVLWIGHKYSERIFPSVPGCMSLASTALLLGFYSLLPPAWAIVISELLQGFTYTTFILSLEINLSLSERYPKPLERSIRIAITLLYSGLGFCLGSLLFGYIYSTFGSLVAFRVASVATCIWCIVYMLLQLILPVMSGKVQYDASDNIESIFITDEHMEQKRSFCDDMLHNEAKIAHNKDIGMHETLDRDVYSSTLLRTKELQVDSAWMKVQPASEKQHYPDLQMPAAIPFSKSNIVPQSLEPGYMSESQEDKITTNCPLGAGGDNFATKYLNPFGSDSD